MKKLVLIATLISTPAFADDAVPTSAPSPAAAPSTVQTPPPSPPAAPVSPTAFAWTDMDAGDLANLNACVQELPKKVADQWIIRLSQHIKPVK